jgi:hypothetical protein
VWQLVLDALEILLISVLIAAIAITLVMLRPAARRRRRRRRHSARPRIDLFRGSRGDADGKADLPPESSDAPA